MESKGGFWSTLPGILTALAGLVAAVTTLVATLYKSGVIGGGSGNEGASNVLRAEDPLKPCEVRELRSKAGEFDSASVTATVIREGFFESRRNPTGAGVANRFRVHAIGSAVVVVDDSTGLMWERAGIGPMAWAAGTRRIDQLNAERYLGYADWRLPTVDEAMSVVEPKPASDGFSFSPEFGRSANYIWTCDSAPDERAWMVRYHDAELVAESVRFNAMVRAVRSLAK